MPAIAVAAAHTDAHLRRQDSRARITGLSEYLPNSRCMPLSATSSRDSLSVELVRNRAKSPPFLAQVQHLPKPHFPFFLGIHASSSHRLWAREREIRVAQ